MRFYGKGSLLAALVAAIGIVLLGAGLLVHSTIHPPRRAEAPPDLEAMRVELERVEFPAVDGLRLQGWHVPGSAGTPAIVLCHDLGGSRSSLFGLAYDLSRSGFPLLLFDFRGHGSSAGDLSTLGIEEKRDILGAVDFLAARDEYRGLPVGVYGVGMGAHAAVLAAADRKAIRVLVLDGLYPDASFRLSRRVFAGWGAGIRHLSFLPKTIFALLTGNRPDQTRAADVLPGLRGRDVLLLAAASDAVLAEEVARVYESIPVQRYVDGNLELLPVTHVQGLFGDDRNRHHGRVRDFFLTRLGSAASTRTPDVAGAFPKSRNSATNRKGGLEGI